MNAPEAVARLRLLCRGTLQGVGFRPTVLRLGTSLALDGWVRNRIDGVELELVGPRRELEHFQALLPGALPPTARLESLDVTWLEVPAPGETPAGLRIVGGDQAAECQPLGAGWLAPGLRADRAPCRRCWQEFNDPANRRFRDPFIGCCDCGPRYAISTAMPFLRAHTSLGSLSLCEACRREAADPSDRRFHCETISCPACGPQLRWIGEPATGDPLKLALQLLHRGGILALQGIAGFQLLVEAGNRRAIERLRQRKHRPHQPLALLGASVEALGAAVTISPAERRLLQAPAAPIVLLARRRDAGQLWPGIADGAPALGMMLPASGLHRLLVEGFGAPLVATSANRHGDPMWISAEEAEAGLDGIADGVLLHDRTIVRPLDDSVAQVIDGRPRLLRRARGYVPEPIPIPGGAGGAAKPGTDGALLALGADLKSAPALAIDQQLWLAAPFGSLDHPRHGTRFEAAIRAVLKEHPEARERIVCDAHPGYRSAQLAQRLGAHRGLAVAHHQAHGLAVLAEHGLSGPMLLLCADGVGFDPADSRAVVRGCELLLVPRGPGPIRRLGELRPFALPGAELACLEPRRCALGLLAGIDPALVQHPGANATRKAFMGAERALVLSAIAGGCNSPPCTSLGRLFDGVASLLGLVQILSFEGQGGLWLEGAAAGDALHGDGCHGAAGQGAPEQVVVSQGLQPMTVHQDRALWQLDWRPWLLSCLEQRSGGVSVESLAAHFQRSLAAALAELAALAGRLDSGVSSGPVVRVALAGGCFQNAALLRQTATQLRRRGLQPFWSEQLPCHDGGLALGQVAAWRRQIAADQGPSERGLHP